jgi:hypothetical protein
MSTTPWIWGWRTDVAVFGGSGALALSCAALAGVLAPDGALPSWAWFLFVVGLDVTHVWTTLFRTYLDRAEVARRRALYLGLPVGCYLVGLALHAHSPLTFWRVLAYAAVFHFVRQQVGWVAIYRARAGERERIDRWLDDALIYAATLWPLLHWHAHLPRHFSWFVPGDFVTAAWLAPAVPLLGVVYLAIAAAYVLRNVARARRGHPLNLGKHLVVVTTALCWYVGIVASNQDFRFTVTNVVIHAVPYMALLWAYARERSRELAGGILPRIVGYGVGAFVALALGCAFMEELIWERLVWHDRPGWFGGAERDAPLLGSAALTLLVPLLALPQAVHYALDGLLWRRKDSGLAQARALGFVPSALGADPLPHAAHESSA